MKHNNIDLFLRLDNKYNTEFTNKLYKNQHIFREIYNSCNNTFFIGCGSYLFDGQKYEYSDSMYEKQELLYNSVKNISSVLEIGTYMGHSLLIMLLSNPNLKITCIDIDNTYTAPAIEVLNKYFHNKITFIHGNSLTELPKLKIKFDLFHIDGHHENNFIYREFNYVYNLNNNPNILKIIFDDEDSMRPLQKYIKENYNVVKEIIPTCSWANIYFEIKIKSINYSFDYKMSTPLCEIMGRNKSDKGHLNITSSWHNYTTFYYSIFKNRINERLRLFELGLGTNNINSPSNMGLNGRPGASLYGWSEFFPNYDIFGADIDTNILFNTNKIKTFYCDQTNPEIIFQMWNNPILKDKFDIIIDDGLHTFDANVCFFENSIHKLNHNGYYIIEDIVIHKRNLFINKIKEWDTQYYDCVFKLLSIPSTANKHDNTLLVVYKSL